MKKKYYYNENFFKEINNESNAYFLGLLYADGYVNDNLKYVELTLHKDDYKIIDNFIVELKSNRKPIYIKNGKYYRIIINSKKIVNDLIKLGCTNNKTHTLKFPQNIDISLMHHMIRGYFDGDGSIWCNKKGNQYNIQFDGNYDFIFGVSNEINKYLSLDDKSFSKRHKSRNDNIVTLKYGGNCIVKKIYNYLYQNSNFFLERKKSKFLDIKCKYDTKYEYNGIIYGSYNVHILYNIIQNLTNLNRKKIHSRLMTGWSIEDIIIFGKYNKNKKIILKFDLNGIFIEKYDSLKEAGRSNQANPDSISRNARKNRKYKNYYWKFKNEN